MTPSQSQSGVQGQDARGDGWDWLRTGYGQRLKGKVLHPLLILLISCPSLPPTHGSDLMVSNETGDNSPRKFVVAAVSVGSVCAWVRGWVAVTTWE